MTQTVESTRAKRDVEVRRARPSELGLVVDVLTRSFDDDPLTNWAVAQDGKRAERMRLFFQSPVRSMAARHDEIYTTPDVEGAAVWVPPGKFKMSVLEQARQLPDMVRCTTLRRFPAVMKAFNKVEKKHPKEPHWYLMAVGVEPGLQGRSIGSQLLAPVLARCDADGVGAYLESSKERNLPLYERLGFRVTDQFPVSNGAPTIWLMWRDPARRAE
jgi:ribosomal protein S18 acetylase RimI-like enzyme